MTFRYMSDSNQEVVRDYNGSISLGDESVVSIADCSYADDTVFIANSCDQSHITISSTEDISRSAFSLSENTPGAFDLTDSITNDDATRFDFGAANPDNKWTDARARSGKRFEKILGEGYFRAGRFDIKPVIIKSI